MLDSCDQSRPVAVIVAEAIDLNAVVAGIGINFELDGISVIDAYISREAFDVCTARPAQVPNALRSAGQLILEHNAVRHDALLILGGGLLGGLRQDCVVVRRGSTRLSYQSKCAHLSSGQP